jgi:hypothetical protein
MLPLRSKRKFSRIGSADFAGMAFATAITPLRSSELEMISFIMYRVYLLIRSVAAYAYYGMLIEQI